MTSFHITRASLRLASLNTIAGNGRLLPLHLLLVLAMFTTTVKSRPLGFIIEHQNIVMTLHGLFDHVDVESVKDGLHRKAVTRRVRSFQSRLQPWYDSLEEDIPSLPEQQEAQAMHDLYRAVDFDDDGRMKLDELASWLLGQIDVFVERSEAEARQVKSQFDVIDLKHATSVAKQIDATEAEVRFQFADADGNNRLEDEEVETFLHPGLSAKFSRQFAQGVLEKADDTGDQALDIVEFLDQALAIPSEGSNQFSAQAFDHRSEREERKREFQRDFDKNNDLVLDIDELTELMDPRHYSHAINEAYDIFRQADANGDHELSFKELQRSWQRFRTSKLINFEHHIQHDYAGLFDDMVTKMRKRHMKHDEL